MWLITGSQKAREMMGDDAIPVLGDLLRRLQACHHVAMAEKQP